MRRGHANEEEISPRISFMLRRGKKSPLNLLAEDARGQRGDFRPTNSPQDWLRGNGRPRQRCPFRAAVSP